MAFRSFRVFRARHPRLVMASGSLALAALLPTGASLLGAPQAATTGGTQISTPVALVVDGEPLLSDGNGVFEPGERVAVAPAWQNGDSSPQPLTGTASAFTGPPGPTYDLVIDFADYGMLEPGEIASCQATGSCYQMDAGPQGVPRPVKHWDATFDETLSDGTTLRWALHLGESFLDVPRTSLFYRSIETALHHGVTTGCSDTEFCPTAMISRAQMPVFVLRALEGSDYAPPPCEPESQVFADVPFDSPFCPWIEELAMRGVVAGCGGGNYCPGASVTRAQAAVFLLKTLAGASYTPPPCTGVFSDVPCPSLFANWIEDLFKRQVTAGCSSGPPAYCPAAAVKREQMAVFVTRTFGLTLYGPNAQNNPPVVSPATFPLEENSAEGTVVGTVTFTDPNAGQSHTFAITGGNTDGAFAIETETGEITVVNGAALDFETTPAFDLTVEVTDDGIPPASSSATVTVELADVNEVPEVSAETFTVAENSADGTVVGTVTFTDPDAGQSHTFAITGGNPDGAFAIEPSTGELTVANGTALDFETNPTFSLTVEVTDDGTPPLSGSATVTVDLTDGNDAPELTPATFTVEENSAGGTVVGTVMFTDVDAGQSHTFTITGGNPDGAFAIGPSTGEITVANAAALDFETTPTFALIVEVTDDGTPPLSGSATVTVELTDLNEAPEVTPETFPLVENSGDGTLVGTVSFTDPEAGQGHTFAITGGNTDGAFAIGATTGQITVANAAALDFEANPSFALAIEVSDDGTPPLSGSGTVTVTLSNVNEAPTAGNDAAATDEDTAIVIDVLANDSDPDVGDTLTIVSIGGSPAGTVINNGTTISYDPGAAFNSLPAGGSASDSFTYTIQDAGGLSSTATVTVTIGGLNDAPVAGNDAYDAIGNTQLAVEKNGPFDVPTFSSTLDDVLANDADPDTGDTVSVVPFADTLPSGAELDLAADGSFFYTPPAGQATPDSFSYTLEDSTGATATGQVTIDIAKRVWYVDNTANGGTSGTGGGTATDPFSTLSDGGANGDPDDAEDASAAGDIVYIFRGDGTATNQAAGILLKGGQRLLGEAVDLVVDPDDGGPQPPATLFPGNPANRPLVSHGGAGSAVAVLANTASGAVTGLEIRGLGLSSTGGNAIDVTSADAVDLDVRIADNVVSGAGAEGIDINVGSTDATQTLALQNNAVTATGTGIEVTRTAGTLTLTAFGNNTVGGATGGAGIRVGGGGGNVIFDAVPGGSFDTVAGGTLTIGASGDPVGGAGMTLFGVAGDLSYTGITIHAGNGLGLQFGGTGAFTGTTGARLRHLTPGTGVIAATGGAAVDLGQATVDLRLAMISCSNSSGNGVRLAGLVDGTGTTAQFAAGSGSGISGAAGEAFLVDGGNATVVYGGTISNSAGRSVVVQNRTGDTATFSGNVSDTGTGILVSSSSGSTTSFQGGMTLSTGANAAFTASNGGTVTVCDENPCNPTATGTLVNTLTTTTAAALNVNNTNIGAGWLEFRSISSNGAPSGIMLNNTGSSGGLTVRGTAAADSGGTIQNSIADGVSLTNTGPVSLTQMNITSSGQSHIDAVTVNGLSLTNVDTDLSAQAGIRGTSITNLTISGGTFDRGGLANTICNINGLDFTNLLGTSTVTGATFRRSNTIQFRVNNNTATDFAGTPDTLTVSGTTWSNHNQPLPNGTLCFGDHLSVNSDTGGNFRLIVNDASGINIVNATNDANGGGIGVQASAGGTNGKMDVSVTGLKTSKNTAGVVVGNTGTSSTVAFDVFGNKTANGTGFSGTGSLALAVTHVSSGGATTGTIDDNSVTHTAGPGTNAVQVVLEGGGTVTTRISNNVVSGNFQRGFQGQSRLGTGTLNLTLDNNTFTGTDTTGTALQVVNLETGGSGMGHGNAICLNMLNNDVMFGPGATYLASYRLVGRGPTSCTLQSCVFALQDFSGDGSNATDVANWVTSPPKSNTTGGNTVAVTVAQPFQTSAGCPTP